MNNFDKVKRDALNELNAEQSQQLIKANTLQILNLIFTDEMDENKLNELSKRQIDLVNFYYEKGYHFEMMHGIINGCYEKICDLYSQSVSHTYECMLNDLNHKVAMYCLQSDFLKSAIAIESKEMQQELTRHSPSLLTENHRLSPTVTSTLTLPFGEQSISDRFASASLKAHNMRIIVHHLTIPSLSYDS